MTRINTSTNIIGRNKEGTVPPIMTNSVKNPTMAIQQLIKVITDSDIKIDGDCVIAVAFHQQGIYSFDDLQTFDFTNDFETCFTTYKAKDADVGTSSGTDIFIKMETKMYIRWLLLWTRYREDNKHTDTNWNNWKTWTHEEFREFKLAYRRGDIIPKYAHEPKATDKTILVASKNNIPLVQQKCQSAGQKYQSDGFKTVGTVDRTNFVPYVTGKINNDHHVPCVNNDNNIKNACAIDRINFVPCATGKIVNGHHVPCNNNNIKTACPSDRIDFVPCATGKINNGHNVLCDNNNIKCDIYDPPTINYDNITLNKNIHKEHQFEPSPLSNKSNVTAPNTSERTHELLFKEASNMEELMNNTIEMKQLLHDTSTTGTPDNLDNKALISVMISSMKHIVDRSKPASASPSTNDVLTHNTHDVRQYKYASDLNNSKWAIKAMKTKTDVNLRRTPVPDVNLRRTPVPGEFSAPHIHRESYIPFASSKRKFDTTITDNELPLTTSLNGELERFRVTNRGNEHGIDGNHQDNGEYWKSHRIIQHRKVDLDYNSYNVIIAWGNGEVSEVPLTLFEHDAPDECARYAKENQLLNEPGWRRYQPGWRRYRYEGERQGINDNEDSSDNDEHQSEDENNNNDMLVDNNNGCTVSDADINIYRETIDSLQWVSSKDRSNSIEHALAPPNIKMNNNTGNKRIHRSPLLTHINEEKETSMIKLECNTANISSNEEEEDWNLVTNDQIRVKTIRKHQMKKALVDGGANGGIAGTEDSLPWDSNINDGRSVKVTGLGERTVSNVPIGSVCAVSNSLDGSVLCIYHNYAIGQIQPTTIHSKVQLQDYNNIVD